MPAPDIFHKNQWQSVAVHDLSDNLQLSGRVALVVFPFPQPLVLTRVRGCMWYSRMRTLCTEPIH